MGWSIHLRRNTFEVSFSSKNQMLADWLHSKTIDWDYYKPFPVSREQALELKVLAEDALIKLGTSSEEYFENPRAVRDRTKDFMALYCAIDSFRMASDILEGEDGDTFDFVLM